MSSYREELRKKSATAIEDRRAELENSKKTKYGDERIYKIAVDKNGQSETVIRFLPAPRNEGKTWVEKYTHNFEGSSGSWFVENCPTTINEDCPVCAANRNTYKSNVREVAQKKTQATKRHQKFYSNILVVEDKLNPENEGKVFLFEYGPKIKGKIDEAIEPLSSRQKAIDPFDPFENGANFVILAKTVDRQRNYDSSKFESTSVITEDDAELDKILESLYSLEAIVNKGNFKSYESLKQTFDRVNGTPVGKYETEEEEEESSELPVYEEPKAPTKRKTKVVEEDDEDLKDIDLDSLPF